MRISYCVNADLTEAIPSTDPVDKSWCQMGFTLEHLYNLVVELGLAAPEAVEVVEQDVDQVFFVHAGFAAGVGGDEDVFEAPKGGVLGVRLFPEVVDAGAGDGAGLEGGQHGGFVDAAAAGDVDQVGAFFHLREGRGVDDVLGCRRQGTGEGDEIGLGEEGGQVIGRVDGVGGCGGGGGVAFCGDDAHVEGLGEFGEAGADLAEADDEEGLAAQLVFARGEVADHAAPGAALLAVAAGVDVAGEGEDEGHGVFADGVAVDAAGGGQADAALAEGVEVELVDAGADGLDEAEAGRDVEELVLPEAGDEEDIGLREAGSHFLRGPGLEVPDALLPGGGVAVQMGLAAGEDRFQLIGYVGEADGQVCGRGKGVGRHWAAPLRVHGGLLAA